MKRSESGAGNSTTYADLLKRLCLVRHAAPVRLCSTRVAVQNGGAI
jgi:hypothetical protein